MPPGGYSLELVEPLAESKPLLFVKVVSERLGHGTLAFTMTACQHVLPGMQREAVQLVANQKTKAARHLRVVNE